MMLATKMARNREAAVNLGKQMVVRNFIHHVVYEHNFEVRTQLACWQLLYADEANFYKPFLMTQR